MTPERLAAYRKLFAATNTEELRAMAEGRKPHNLGDEGTEAMRLVLEERKASGHVDAPAFKPRALEAGVKGAPVETSKPRRESPRITPAAGSHSTPLPSLGPSGVRGWLLFFCVCLTILGPLVGFGMMRAEWQESQVAFSQFPSLKLAMIGANFIKGVLLLYGFHVGWTIWSGSPKGREVAKRFLLISLFGSFGVALINFIGVLGIGDLSASSSEHLTLVLLALFYGIFGPLYGFLIWWFYFQKSKRVRNTYGPPPEAYLLGGETNVQRLALATQTGPAKTSGMAIWSLVLCVLPTAGITALLGLILGFRSMRKIEKSGGQLRGHGIAVAGTIVSGFIVLLIPMMAALVFSAHTEAKARIQTMSCVTNITQLALQVLNYASDHQNQFPPAETWCDTLQSTGLPEETFRCPTGDKDQRCHYAYNAKLSGLEKSSIDYRDTVLLFETKGGWNLSGGRKLLLNHPRHGQIVVAFVDGRVERVPEWRISALRWDP
jgi:hypothetical protein